MRVLKADGKEVFVGNIVKMSKTKRNIVDPDEIIGEYGGDTARVAAANEMAVNQVRAKRNCHARQRGGARFVIPG